MTDHITTYVPVPDTSLAMRYTGAELDILLSFANGDEMVFTVNIERRSGKFHLFYDGAGLATCETFGQALDLAKQNLRHIARHQITQRALAHVVDEVTHSIVTLPVKDITR